MFLSRNQYRGRMPGCFVLLAVMLCASSCSKPAVKAVTSVTPPQSAAVQPPGASAQSGPQQGKVFVLSDFRSGDFLNRAGGNSGTWNMDPSDINNSYADQDLVDMAGADGTVHKVLRLNYSVDSDRASQNGFWTQLGTFDAREYDHLELVLKGDPEKGCTDRFKLEIKKCKTPPCTGDPVRDEVIKGSSVVPVTSEWQTVRIPLNRITGIIDFANPESWKDPSIARTGLDELVFIFQDRMVSRKRGTLYVDEIRFVKTGTPGPTAVDFPKHSRMKTPEKLEGIAYALFLRQRLGGFPETVVVTKDFPKDSREFLLEIARDTWRFFDEIVDRETWLPLDTLQLGEKEPMEEKTFVGDYTNVTNVGIYLMCLVSAYDLGFLTKEAAVVRIRKTLTSMETLKHHASGWPYNYYDTTLGEATSYFVSLVDSSWLLAGYYVVKQAFPEEVGAQAQKAIDRGKLSFFYDPLERQMYHGFYDHLGVYSDYHYGSFYTEPRIASYMAIARNEAPREHWFGGLVRTFPDSFAWQSQKPIDRFEKTAPGGLPYFGGYYRWKDLEYVPSWGGSAFEALMPTLILKEKEIGVSGLGVNDERHARGQMRYALEELKLPVWGMSPSSVPEGGYSEFGAKPFGAKGYKSGAVTPHASVLALEWMPEDVIRNLRELLARYDIYGEYGFYDAVNPETGLVAHKYLSLDQGMILIAINNYLNDGAIRKRFHREPAMKQAEDLLSSEDFFEHPPGPDTKSSAA
ncbi:MAG: glucoamylase family protein [Candidatus Omnitrophota bacterium]|jgi:hypothetical protein